MVKRNERNMRDEIKLSDLLKVLVRKKWWFIGTFIIVLAAGLLFTFLRTPQYNLTSTLIISDIQPDYYNNLMRLFPEKTTELIGMDNISESEEFLSEDLLEEVVNDVDYDMDIDELNDTIFVYTKQGGILKLTTVNDDENITYEINKVLLEKYLDKRDYEIELAYNNLLDEIDSKMSDILKEIEELAGESGDNGTLSDREIDLKYETYYGLEESKNVLIENKDYFTERIIVSEGPNVLNVYGYFNYKRDVVFSFFLAVALGVITAFVANYFQSLKK